MSEHESEQPEPAEETEQILNPERILVDVGALEPTADGDLTLTESFQDAWEGEIENVKQSDAQREEILEVLGLEGGDVSFEVYEEAYKIMVDGNLVGVLESQGAFYADLAGARLLADRHDDWDALAVGDRSRLLKGLRLFLEHCPECGNDVTFDTKEVESCCGSHPVAAVDCGVCGSRLFESAPLEGDL